MKKLLLGLVLLTGYHLRAADSKLLKDEKAGQKYSSQKSIYFFGQKEVRIKKVDDGSASLNFKEEGSKDIIVDVPADLVEKCSYLKDMFELYPDDTEEVSTDRPLTEEAVMLLIDLWAKAKTVEAFIQELPGYSFAQLVDLWIAIKNLDFEYNSEQSVQNLLKEKIGSDFLRLIEQPEPLDPIIVAKIQVTMLCPYLTELLYKNKWRLKNTLQGHAENLFSVALSPNGQLIATGSLNGTAKVWNVQTGQCLHTLQGHVDLVRSVVFSPDGTQIATASEDHTAKVWNAQTGECLRTLQGHTSHVYSVAFSPNRQLIATASWDHTVKVWDPQTGECLRTLQGHTNGVTSVVFSPDGTQIATASEDHTAKVWDTETGQCLHTLEGHTSRVLSVVFSPNCQLIATGSWDNTAKVWDAQTGQCLHTLQGHTNLIYFVTFSSDGESIVTASIDSTAKVWFNNFAKAGIRSLEQVLQFSILKVLHILKTGEMPVGKIPAADSQTLQDEKAGQKEKIVTLTLSDRKTEVKLSSSFAEAFTLLGNILEDLGESDKAISVNNQFVTQDTLGQFKALDSQLIVTVEDVLAIINQYSLEQLVRLFLADNFLEFSREFTMEDETTKQLADILFEKIIKLLIDTEDVHAAASALALLDQLPDIAKYFKTELYKRGSWFCLHTLQGNGDSINSVAFSADGQLIATALDNGTAKLWNPQTGQILHTLQAHTATVNSVAFSPDSQLIATCSSDRTVILWNTQTGELLHTLQGHTGWISSVAFSPDGKLFATGSWDNTTKVWDAQTGQLLRTLEGHTNWINSVAFSPDSQLVAAGSGDGAVILWNTQTGELLHTLQGHTGWISSVAFSPDGKLFATGSWDSTTKIWDAQTGQLLRTLEGHTGWVNSVEFSPDGQLIVKGSSNNAAMLFDPQTGQCLYMLQGHTGWVNSVVLSPDRSMVVTGSDDGTAKIWRNKFLKEGITSLEQALQLPIQDVLYIVKTVKTPEQMKKEWKKKNDFMGSIIGVPKVTGPKANQTFLDDVD